LNKYTTLFIATHTTTGLKYLAKTTRYHSEEILQEKYHGSGVYWKRHLNKHGDNVNIEIIGTFETSEIKKYAIAISFAYDVANSNEWANLMPENGLDGGCSGTKHSNETKIKIGMKSKNRVPWNKGKKIQGHRCSEETKKKISVANQGQVPWHKGKTGVYSAETKKKMAKVHRGRIRTESTKQKIKEALSNLSILECPHCDIKSKSRANMNRWHFDNCKNKKENNANRR